MDLEIILDASTSRQEVFEHQRELALSLIERLPVDAGDTHVAVGVNSFTSVPTLRQTLGLGRDRQMVRHAIEDIKYNGGSTLTAQAVDLSVEDLERGRRSDAVQVVVLMNDGMSQDPWEDVLKSSERLRATGAERFGVALGDKVDLRELMHYIGDEKRIYRDGSTERFLSDVVSLLTGGEDCEAQFVSKPPLEMAPSKACEPAKVDIMVVFDNSDGTSSLTDPSVNSNKYLLLDVLGSLPTTSDGQKIQLSIISFAMEPNLLVGFNDNQQKETVFRRVEEIKAEHGKPAYAKAINFALEEYEKSHRANTRGILLIVGDGKSDDAPNERKIVAQDLQKQKDLSCFAVDSGKAIDADSLAEYTGSIDRVFNYDRNAEFAKKLLNEVIGSRCIQDETKESKSAEKIIEIPSLLRGSLRDIANKPDNDLKDFENEKLVVKEKSTASTKM
uniref:VWFA domain-containing protein n=1 Tax=Parascaris univalens TaxID=6257 RepID=A0A915CJG5_PARUN